MMKALLSAAAMMLLFAAPAYSQSTSQATHSGATAASGTAEQDAFLARQDPSEWRGSKLIGASVYGPDDKSIGNINDILVGQRGGIRAVVIGVGGFLGIGEKNVAVPFQSLRVTRKPNASSIEKVTMAVTKEELQTAPKFVFLEANGANNTTAGPATRPGNSPTATNASGSAASHH